MKGPESYVCKKDEEWNKAKKVKHKGAKDLVTTVQKYASGSPRDLGSATHEGPTHCPVPVPGKDFRPLLAKVSPPWSQGSSFQPGNHRPVVSSLLFLQGSSKGQALGAEKIFYQPGESVMQLESIQIKKYRGSCWSGRKNTPADSR